MSVERFRGADFSQVADRARRTFGDDVMILHTRTVRDGVVPMVEVIAAPAATIDRMRARLEAAPFPVGMRAADGQPYRIALVGPTGAGKTTTAAKLAVGRRVFAAARTGLLTIDTYRIGGMEQLATYAELGGVPFEVVYDASEVPAALKRLSACDVIIIDTPGRSPLSAELTEQWRTLLDAIAPHETHLVMPASVRADLAHGIARAYGPTRIESGAAHGCAAHNGATHLLISKLDEVPRANGVADLASSIELPMRWITDGQNVPDDIRAGVPRMVRACGLAADAEMDWVAA